MSKAIMVNMNVNKVRVFLKRRPNEKLQSITETEKFVVNRMVLKIKCPMLKVGNCRLTQDIIKVCCRRQL